MSDTLKATPTARLKTMVENTEGLLGELKGELQRREEEKQHEAIDRLESYLDVAEQRFGPLIELIATIMNELRGKKEPESES